MTAVEENTRPLILLLIPESEQMFWHWAFVKTAVLMLCDQKFLNQPSKPVVTILNKINVKNDQYGSLQCA